MYKVFINDKPIIFTDSAVKIDNYNCYTFNQFVLKEIAHKHLKNIIEGSIIYCKDLPNCWNNFKSTLPVIEASGGLVINSANDFLFIYRNETWDLPKGRIEKGETIDIAAVREVEEECGIDRLELRDFLTTTYHLFYFKDEIRLKVTHWFLMNTNYKGELIPQLEEGITKVEFKNKEQVSNTLKNSYANIQ